ncbi:hypothetical protein [Caballeronia sp. RCC_10]|uniref:hypothetical protein n=1 Tax=Caballeronia sp. RCC_10 TaxID=3239227 RepID=UPI0035260A46
MIAVKYADLSMAFDFVSDASPMEHSAYVSLDTGKVYWTSDFDDAFDEDHPDDLETSDRYLAIPHKNELDLGKSLALRFVAQQCLRVMNWSKGFSNGTERMGASRIFWRVKALSSAGTPLKLPLSKAR